MKAAVFHKPGEITYNRVPDPRIELATDIILKVTSTAICGSDLHILSGAVPQKEPMVMSPEFRLERMISNRKGDVPGFPLERARRFDRRYLFTLPKNRRNSLYAISLV